MSGIGKRWVDVELVQIDRDNPPSSTRAAGVKATVENTIAAAPLVRMLRNAGCGAALVDARRRSGDAWGTTDSRAR